MFIGRKMEEQVRIYIHIINTLQQMNESGLYESVTMSLS